VFILPVFVSSFPVCEMEWYLETASRLLTALPVVIVLARVKDGKPEELQDHFR
jgi:hypothetical protein